MGRSFAKQRGMLDWLLDSIRCCASCGTSWGTFSWLCSSCEGQWVRRLKLRQRWIDRKIVHYYLVDWSPKDKALSSLVYSLKQGGRRREFDQWISIFPTPSCSSSHIFYPSKGLYDHGQELAESAAAFMGNKQTTPIVKVKGAKQALLGRKARLEQDFRAPFSIRSPVLFVDDIVTTGGTARSCWKALGQPSKMTVWSLFYRKSL